MTLLLGLQLAKRSWSYHDGRMGNFSDILKKREEKVAVCRGSLDKRKERAGHSYALVVADSFAQILDFLSRGDTVSGIFEHFRSEETFDETADYKHFHQAVLRECQRRGIDTKKQSKSKSAPQPKTEVREKLPLPQGSEPTIHQPVQLFERHGQKLSPAEVFEEGGKRFSIFNGRKIFLQTGKMLDEKSGLQFDEAEFARGYRETMADRDDDFKNKNESVAKRMLLAK